MRFNYFYNMMDKQDAMIASSQKQQSHRFPIQGGKRNKDLSYEG